MAEQKSKPGAKQPKDLKKKQDLSKVEVAKAVGGTLGPKGRNVILDK